MLKDILAAGMEKVFSPPAEPRASVTMVYSAQELHSRLEPQREAGREALHNLQEGLKSELKDAKERYRLNIAPSDGYTQRQGATIVIPGGPIDPKDVASALNSFQCPPCFSRRNVRPEGAEFLFLFLAQSFRLEEGWAPNAFFV